MKSLVPILLLALLLFPAAAGWLDFVRETGERRYAFRDPGRRVVVLGFDGVDPDILREYLARLPAVARLDREGTFTECRTTNPPESPVAWATFVTGCNPGQHGIFDFVRRDPGADDPYRPLNGMVDGRPAQFGPLGLPIRPPAARNLRGGEGFWEPVARQGYRVCVLRMPLTFPPEPARGGVVLCGLGVPDARGTQGSYTLFKAGPNASDQSTIFGGRHVKIYPRQGVATAKLEGPPDPRAQARRLFVPVRITFSGNHATVSVDGATAVPLTPDLYSGWVPVRFTAGPFVRLHGMVRFLLLATGEEAAVYASPIQLAPHSPPLPISSPASFAARMAERLGPMKTSGWPEDTFAANERVLSDAQAFLDIQDTYRSHERLLLDRLDHSGASLVTMIFTAQDRVSHLFFRYRDTTHPAHDEEEIAAFEDQTGIEDPIFESYRWMDETLAAVQSRLEPQDILLVVSDHGFHSWRHGVNINTWLEKEGYLTLADPAARRRNRTLEQFFRKRSETAHIDWKKTRAYALGLGQIYVNIKGREGSGIVEPADRDALCDEISLKLLSLRGPGGKSVFTRVFRAENIWKGERIDAAPDLQCAFAEGFRVSWQTSLLGVPREIFVVNDFPWSGDHCSNDAAQTAGIFLSNRRLAKESDPGLEDMAPTICSLFSAPPPRGSVGRTLQLR